MSKEKQFENIENKIKEALQHGEHPFDEAAWTQMEALLEKENKKRRPLLWLWLLPILLIGTLAIIKFIGNKEKDKSQNSITSSRIEKGNNPNVAITEKQNKLQESVTVSSSEHINQLKESKGVKQSEQAGQNIAGSTDHVAGNKTPSVETTKNSRKSKNNLVEQGSIANKKDALKKSFVSEPKNKRWTSGKKELSETKTQHRGNLAPENRETSANQKNKVTVGEKISVASTSATPESADSVDVAKTTIVIVDSASLQPVAIAGKTYEQTPAKNNTALKKKETISARKGSKFYLLGLIGGDIGSVKLLSYKNSSVVARYGFGIGYQFSKRFSVQTGFYADNKKYTAAGGDYHVKAGSYWDMYKITSVDAACKVYDIPLSIRYDLSTTGSVRYYAMAGMSSYIMKKEDYDYYYLRWGVPAEKSYSYSGNKHLFSNANISFGLEKRLSSSFFLQFEPSLSIPLSGVGDGKVKLYSTSIMLGLKYLPFKK